LKPRLTPRDPDFRKNGGVHVTKHPQTNLLDVVCANCGATFLIRSTAASVSVDVCSNCHPAYTGVQQTAARGSRIDRFNRRRTLAAA
jgi:large subunit ribosomal protein L31